MKITLAQLNPTVGAIEQNLGRAIEVVDQYSDNSDLILFPELYLTGYPPRDLLLTHGFIDRVDQAINRLTSHSAQYPGIGIIIGLPIKNGNDASGRLFNSAALISNGEIRGVCHKSLLPYYDVFDEPRYFNSADNVNPLDFHGEKLGLTICEDYWNEADLWPFGGYHIDPIKVLADKGATMFINISASPFVLEKDRLRLRLITNHIKTHNKPFVFVNQVGGNDELIFDGRSICLDSKSNIIDQFPAFEEHIGTVDLAQPGKSNLPVQLSNIESAYKALILGLHDYLNKTGFDKAVIGLSGGIDSAVVCVLAAHALGSDKVTGIAMPSEFTSDISIIGAERLANNLGIEFISAPIKGIYDAYVDGLKPALDSGQFDVTFENIQARIRGNILMAYSNRHGHILLTTGNKSEIATGYCTLYGDMAGGLAVISDVPKTMVYKLAEYMNRDKEIIPREIIDRPPSAELRPDQTDQDTLPSYNILDAVLHLYIEESLSPMEIKEKGFDEKTVDWIIKTVNRNEYKRRQAPPGLKITSKAFGVGRRMPIAAKY